MQTKNILVVFENGDNVLFYVDQTGVDCDMLRKWTEEVTGCKVLESYEIPQSDLQYHCIDERVWVDTPEKAEKIRTKANP